MSSSLIQATECLILEFFFLNSLVSNLKVLCERNLTTLLCIILVFQLPCLFVCQHHHTHIAERIVIVETAWHLGM